MEGTGPEQAPIAPPALTPPREPHGIAPQIRPLEPVNTLGVVAFVLSLAGIFCVPGIASLAGLICGIIAMRRTPRALAIVAVVLSAIGVLLLVVAIAYWFFAFAPMVQTMQGSAAEFISSMRADQALNGVRASGTPLADHASIDECLPPSALPADHWGSAMRAEFREIASGRCVLIWSAGADGVWGSEDDFVAACEPPDAAMKMGLPTAD